MSTVTEEYFKKQIGEGAVDRFSYAVENRDEGSIDLKVHKGPLDEFPDGMVFVRYLASGGSVPVFTKE